MRKDERLLTENELFAAFNTVAGDRTFLPREMMAAARAQDAKTTAYWRQRAGELLELLESVP